MIDEEKMPQTATTFSIKKGSQTNRKARPILVDRIIEESRERVIEADLELSFVKSMKIKFSEEGIPFEQLMFDEKIMQMTYEYWLERLNYFKEMRDRIKSKEELKRIEKEVIEKTPEVVKVTKEE